MIEGIRGATSVEKDEPREIIEKSKELIENIMVKNKIDRIISIIVTVTDDIKSFNPATAIRKSLNIQGLSIMCVKEAFFKNSPEKIIRVLINCESQTKEFVYLHKAANLIKKATERMNKEIL